MSNSVFHLKIECHSYSVTSLCASLVKGVWDAMKEDILSPPCRKLHCWSLSVLLALLSFYGVRESMVAPAPSAGSALTDLAEGFGPFGVIAECRPASGFDRRAGTAAEMQLLFLVIASQTVNSFQEVVSWGCFICSRGSKISLGALLLCSHLWQTGQRHLWRATSWPFQI